jgi:hypothetical protein
MRRSVADRLTSLVIVVAVVLCASQIGHTQIRAYLNSAESAGESDRGRALLEQLQQEIDQLERAPRGRYCGTGLADLLGAELQQLSAGGLDVVRRTMPALVQRPAPLSDTFDVATAPFRIHYTTSGEDAVLNATTDTAADGVPTYVHVAAEALSWAYELFTDSMGYVPPLPDGDLGGGVDLYDCYLVIPELGPNIVAFTATDIPGFIRVIGDDTIHVNSSYQVVHPTMAPFTQLPDPLDLLRITCAHELFHALHFSLDADEKPASQRAGWWLEGNAVWFEDYAFPDINDWSNLPAYLNEPERSITSSPSSSDLHPYGGGSMWSFFLVERFGVTDPLGRADIIRRIWDRCARVSGDNTLAATDSVLQADFGVSLNEAWFEFSSWCMRTGSRWDPSSFMQGAQWAEVQNVDTLGDRRLFRYPGAIHITDESDTLDQLVGPGIPVRTVRDTLFPLQAMAFGPAVTLIPIPTTGPTFRVRPVSDDATATAFFSLGRDTLPSPSRWEIVDLPVDQSTVLANWPTYDSIMIVAAAGAAVDSFINGSPVLRPFMPVLISAVDTGITLLQGVFFEDAYPNPLRLDQGEQVHFGLVIAEPLDVVLDIFTLSGDRVRSVFLRGAVNVVDMTWDATNEAGRPVASGLYLCRIAAGGAERVYRVGVLR